VIKDAKKIDGLFTMYQKDEKVWLELKPSDLGKPLLFSPKLAGGIGEAGIFGGSMNLRGAATEEQLVEFRRVHNQIQLIARNSEFFAKPGTPEARAVTAAFSPSLLGSSPVASQPQPERKSILIDASGLFASDMLGFGQALQRAYRQGYAFDGRNSAVLNVRGKTDSVVFEVQNHYATASIALPQPNTPPGAPVPTAPRTLPDARSLFLQLEYSLARLPEEPMKPRAADPRVGYFQTLQQDFSDDLARSPRQRYVNRWRLVKKDPAAALSEPVKPITYWLDRSIPLKYRATITAGVLEWNKAFEKIGFKNAIAVRQQPDDADFSTLDSDVPSIRWVTNVSPQYGAIGPSHVDPRSGEILDADIAIESLSSRAIRAQRSQILGGTPAAEWASLMQLPDAMPTTLPGGAPVGSAAQPHDPKACEYADFAAEQLGYMMDVLEARGDIDPDSPEAQRFVLDYLKDVTMHEVGHTLGLRHNFRASRLYSQAELEDDTFTHDHSLSGSVMEYLPLNLPSPGHKIGTSSQATLGPYDYWAIEYAYKPLEPAKEADALQQLAARSSEPELAYGTDEDNFLGIDPESLQFDLGNDVLAFARKRFEIARDLLARQEVRTLKPSEDYSVLRRSLNFALRDVARSSGALARQIGGVRTLRDYPGSGRDPLEPVSPQAQRAALEVLAKGVLSPDGLRVSPALQRRLAPDYLERTDAVFSGENVVATDYSPVQAVLEIQNALLTHLMSDGVAVRVLDSETKAERPAEAFHLSELYRRITQEVWGDLGRGDIPAQRRELQREHINKLSAALLRPASQSRADARSLTRVEAQTLLARINAALKSASGLSAESKAHLQDSAESLGLALTAKLQRAGA